MAIGDIGGSGSDGGGGCRGNNSFCKTKRVEGAIFELGGNFVPVVVKKEVDDLTLEVGVVFGLVWGFLNGRLYFLWRLSCMSLKGKMSNVGGRSVGVVMWKNFFIEFFYLMVTRSKMEVLVWVRYFGMLLEVVILV